MRSTMQDAPLLVSSILRHGQRVHPRGTVVTVETGGHRTATFAEVAARAEQLAKALRRLGVGDSDRVGTFSFNHQPHLEAYLAVPSMGAVLHTLNVRLAPDQLRYVIDHAEDKVVIVDAALLPLLGRVLPDLRTVEQLIVVGDGDTAAVPHALGYEEILAAEEPGYEWPELDERSASAMCYTSGTTGRPKGVVYSHRSTYLHTLAQNSSASIGASEEDRILVVVPMFHANAWGTPYAAWQVGADLLFPQHFLTGEHLVEIVAEHRPTLACGVPTIWNDLLRAAAGSGRDLSSLRMVNSGGSAAPRSLVEGFEEQLGIPIVQGWGMTETSPIGAIAWPPAGCPPEDEMRYRMKTGRVVAGVEMRVVGADGVELPADGVSAGELEIRGPWVTGSYYGEDTPERFHDGWLRTGDVGTMDELGYIQITDRTKDIIKSGGEWISSVELEGEVMAHPDVHEAAVVGVPDERWGERPLAVVVPAEGRSPEPDVLAAFLADRVARLAVPDRWAFVDSLPKTSVGKFDKRALRAQYAAGDLKVLTSAPAARGDREAR